LNGYISGLRVVKGTALYSIAFTPAVAAPTAIAGTSLLANFVNAGALDSSKNVVLSSIGNAQISTTASKYGSASMKFDGTNSLFHVGEIADPILSIGTKDFALEGWIYLSAAPTKNGAIYANYGGARTGSYLLRLLSASSKLAFYVYPAADILTSTTVLSAGNWYHFAVTRTGTSLKMFINGMLEASVTGSYNLVSDPSHTATIGGYWQTSAYDANGWFNGYIDDLRLTINRNRYETIAVSKSISGTTETVTFPANSTISELMTSDGLGGLTRVSVTTDANSAAGMNSADPSPNNGVTTSSGASPATLSVNVSGNDISITLPASITTSSALKAVLDADSSVTALVSTSSPTGNTSAFSKTYLSGGADASAGTLSASVSGTDISIAVPSGTTNSTLKSYLEGLPAVAGNSGIIDLSGESGSAPTSSGPLSLQGGSDIQAGSFSSSIDGYAVSISVPLNATNSQLKAYLESVANIAGNNGIIDLVSPVGTAPSSYGPVSLAGGADETPATLSIEVSGNSITINIPASTSATAVASAVNQNANASAIVEAEASDGGSAESTGSVNLTGGIG
jgi:hypothetical protein